MHLSSLPLRPLDQVYLKGLKPEIRAKIALMNPKGLVDVMYTSWKADQRI